MYLIPVTQYEVRFQSSSRRQYFELDRLLLVAIADGQKRTFNELEHEFRLPRRMLVEAIVTLFEDGWLALRYGNGGPLELTTKAFQLRIGERWNWKRFEAPRLPESNTQLVLMDRVVGALARREDVYTMSRNQLEAEGLWDGVRQLDTDIQVATLDEGRLRRVVRPPSQEHWIYSIDPIHPVHDYRGDFYAPVDVDVERQTLIGRIPVEWKRNLKGPALLFARKHSTTVRRPVLDASEVDIRRDYTYTISLSPEDVHFESSKRESALRNLFDRARSGDSILLASSGISAEFFSQDIKELFRLALNRDVRIDMLWNAPFGRGEAAAQFRQTLTDLASSSLRYRNLLRFNTQSTPVGFHVAMLGSPANEPVALFSNVSWFGDPNAQDNGMTVRISFGRLISEACYTLSALFATSDDMEASRHRWRELASMMESVSIAGFFAPPPVLSEGSRAWRCHARLVREYDFVDEMELLISETPARSLLFTDPPSGPYSTIVEGWRTAVSLGSGDHRIIAGTSSESPPQGFLALADDALLLGDPQAQFRVEGVKKTNIGLSILLHSAELSDMVWSRYARMA